jgi:hypothetical protein
MGQLIATEFINTSINEDDISTRILMRFSNTNL